MSPGRRGPSGPPGRTMPRVVLGLAGWLVCVGAAGPSIGRAAPPRPNVLVVLVDDLGYGDLSCHGSPFGPTPHVDAFHASSVRLTDFHVAPMCSPTRGQLLSGQDALRNGSSIVSSSRMMVRAELPLLPAQFAAAGYATGAFGKWHLGENHPHRPEDRGFGQAVWFPLQELGSLSDHWQNDYFDPVLRLTAGRQERFTGYSTDVFFSQAQAWMRQCRERAQPFVCLLALNVVHGPQWAPAELRAQVAARFPRLSPGQVGYLAMLANADENLGRLEQFLRDNGLHDDTLAVFLSDNGGYALVGEYNAGMRGGKSRLTEGGHRVPCFLRWPAGGVGGAGQGRDLPGLTQVQDLLPTLLELCHVPPVAGSAFDGQSLAAPLRGQGPVLERTLVVQYGPPEPLQMCCVMQGPWRLLSDRKGRAEGQPELYHLGRDPLQEENLLAAEPDKAAELRAAYDAWWAGVEPFTRLRARLSLGHPDADPVTLNSAEWRENAMGGIPGLRQGVKRRGTWDVEVMRGGKYRFELRRWPESSGLALSEAAPPWTPRDAATPDHAGYPAGQAVSIAGARLRVGNRTATIAVSGRQRAAELDFELAAGPTELEGMFLDAAGKPLCGTFFVTASYLGPAAASRTE